MDVPKPMPPYEPGVVTRAWWYCLYCKKQDANEYSLKFHVKKEHGDDETEPMKGEDYTNRDHLLVLIERWNKFCLIAADRFALQLASLRGADDFEMEVGDGIPDVKKEG